MKIHHSMLLAATLLAAAGSQVLRADSFGSGNNTFTMDFVEVGDPSNTADGTGYGTVNTVFKMAVHAVSQDMVDVANALGSLGITQDSRSTGMPSTMVNWNEAARFVNWLNTSSGYSVAYKFSTQPGDPGYSASEDISLWESGDDGYNAANAYRNSNAQYFLPSENEWYKAAYYDGGLSVYYDYPTGSDTAPTAVASGTSADTAVYSQAGPAQVTQAGGLSAYGTMGQGGNVWELIESAADGSNDSTTEARARRGGVYSGTVSNLSSATRKTSPPTSEFSTIGFRVAAVPEPSTVVLLGLAGAALAYRLVSRRARR